MEAPTSDTEKRQAPVKEGSLHQEIIKLAGMIGSCAFATFVLGALLNAAWPAAVASCGVSLMGAGIAWFMLRQPAKLP